MSKFYPKLLLFNLMLAIFQIVPAQNNIIKTPLSGFMLGHFSLSYERQTFNKQSIQLKTGYFQPVLGPIISSSTITPSEYTFVKNNRLVQTSLDYRFYAVENDLKGFYIGPYFRYFGIRAEYTDMIKNDSFDFKDSFSSA